MPRGVKGSGTPRVTKSVDKRIAEIDKLIESLQAQLSDARAKRKEFIKEKEQAEYDAIHKIIKSSGMTPDQLKALIETDK